MDIRLGNAEPDRDTWKKAYELFIHAFKDPTAKPERRRLAKLLRKPTSKEVSDEIFGYDAFLRGLGRMSLSECGPGGGLRRSRMRLLTGDNLYRPGSPWRALRPTLAH